MPRGSHIPSSSGHHASPHSDAQYDDLSSIVNPGPIDDSLLKWQDKHISGDCWRNGDSHVLEVRRHNMWDLDPRISEIVTRSGFYPWTLVQNMKVDHGFLTALVERWRPETHTFHLRPGEMTLTLQDVGVITALPVDGRPVTGSEDVVNWDALCMRTLGTVPPRGKSRTSVHRTWFKNNMSIVPPDASEEDLQRYARAYLLCMLGTSLMPDGSGSDVSLHYLQCLADLDSVSGYSWGSAVLAFLYRQLSVACEIGHRHLTGCTVLLQLWAWEHMSIGRPMRIRGNRL